MPNLHLLKTWINHPHTTDGVACSLAATFAVETARTQTLLADPLDAIGPALAYLAGYDGGVVFDQFAAERLANEILTRISPCNCKDN
jgi:hypothetical protein